MEIPLLWQENPLPAIWEKYIFIAPFGLVTALAGCTLGQVMEKPELKTLTRSIMEEIVAIAGKKSIKLPKDIIEKSLNKTTAFPADARTSYQRDVWSKGKKNEGDLYGGTIIRMGKEYGVPTPVTESVYQKIQHSNQG